MASATRMSLAALLLLGCGSSSASSSNPPADGGGGGADAGQDVSIRDGASPPEGGRTDGSFDAGPDGSSSCGFASILDGFVAKRVLYVAPGGKESNDGMSSATAWTTLAHSAALKPGDEVRVATGSYPCPVLGPIAGAAGSPVHFVSTDGPRKAKLDCTAGGALMTNLQYVAFDGFEITGSPALKLKAARERRMGWGGSRKSSREQPTETTRTPVS